MSTATPEAGDEFVTKLLAMSAELTEAKNTIVDLQNKLKCAENMKTTYSSQAAEARAELEQVNLLLDVLPNAPGRKGTGPDEWSRPTNNVMTRLAGYLAVRQ